VLNKNTNIGERKAKTKCANHFTFSYSVSLSNCVVNNVLSLYRYTYKRLNTKTVITSIYCTNIEVPKLYS
jgi:hypothetical protein